MKVVALMLIAVAVAACQRGDDSARAAAAALAPRDAAVAAVIVKPAPPAAPAQTPAFELIDAGREPRTALRYHVPPHTSAALAITVATELLGQHGPAVTLATGLEVGAVDAAGAMQLAVTVRDVAVAGAGTSGAGAMYGAQLGALRALTVHETLLPSGAVRDARATAGATDAGAPMTDELAALARSADQLALPLPDAAVGVGARWRTMRTAKLGPLTTAITTTIELTAIDGDRIAYTLQTALAGAPQTLDQSGTSVAVDQIAGHGEGDGSVDLATLATTQKLTESLTARASIAGVSSPLTASTTITIAPAKAR